MGVGTVTVGEYLFRTFRRVELQCLIHGQWKMNRHCDGPEEEEPNMNSTRKMLTEKWENKE